MDDYLLTSDQLWVPLRWIAPELIDEVHGNLLVVDQTKASNIWSLGVTLWELFQLGRQPYDNYSDHQVLCYVIKEQQLKLPKPQFKHLLSDRWYEVMQFCWLQPEQRPTAEEVHLLLSYLSFKGADELEEEFEKRWNSMRPNRTDNGGHHEIELSSYPLLEHFSSDGYHVDGDDVLNVTHTSQSLNFEYKWERVRHEQYPLNPECQPYQDMYYTSNNDDRLSLGVSPSGYENKDCTLEPQPLELAPVLSAHSPSVAGDYYIRIEEPFGSTLQQDCSPHHDEHSDKEEEGPMAVRQPCENSPSVSLSMVPLLLQLDFSIEADGLLSEVKKQRYCYLNEDGGDKQLVESIIEENNGFSGLTDSLRASMSLMHLCQAQLDIKQLALPRISEKTEHSQYVCTEEIDYTAMISEAELENLQCQDFHQEPCVRTSNHATLSPHWASNMSSNNNVSSEPREHSSGIWCNHRSEETQNAETEPYSPESWQLIDSGEGDHNIILAASREDQYFKAEELKVQGCSNLLETPSNILSIQCYPSAVDALQNEFTVSDITPGQIMDLLGVNLVQIRSEHANNLHITEEEIPTEFSQGVSVQSLSEDHFSNCLSSNKERDSSKKFPLKHFYQIHSDSDKEGTDLTSAVFTDNSSNQNDIVPYLKSLQKPVGTPHSLDSLEMPPIASSSDVFSLGNYSVHYMALDSGYDTENYESPEFVLKESQDNRETEAYYQPNQSQKNSLVPEEMAMSRSVSSDLQSLDAKNPYRDSAYFSDYDSFNREEGEADQRDQREQEEKSKNCVDFGLLTTALDMTSSVENLNSEQGHSVTAADENTSESLSAQQFTILKEVSLLHPPLIVREDSLDEGLGLICQKDPSLEKQSIICSSIESVSHRAIALSPVQLCLTKALTGKKGAPSSITITTGLQAENKLSCNREALGAYLITKCLSPPLICKESKSGESPEDEDAESDDSDESDEELRCYNIQEHSEESEEEHSTVPIIVTDNCSSVPLRSLLKTPNFLLQGESTDIDRKKKVVSFFNDVTVYLFDQESTSLDLAEAEFPELPTMLQDVEQMTFKEPANYLLGDGDLEWDEALPIKLVNPSFITSLTPAMMKSEVNRTPEPIPLPVQKPAKMQPVQLSRFSVSPTAVSRFSITHVTDNTTGSLKERVQTGEQI